MKTAEELNALKEEVETLNKKLAELTEEELMQVNCGSDPLEGLRESGQNLTKESVVYHLGFRRKPVWDHESVENGTD